MYSIGKIGCLLVGCCYGIEYSGPFSIVYNYSYSDIVGVRLFPIQYSFYDYIYCCNDKENRCI